MCHDCCYTFLVRSCPSDLQDFPQARAEKLATSRNVEVALLSDAELDRAAIAICKSAFSKLFIVLLDEDSVSTMSLLDDIEDEVHEVGPCSFGAAGAERARHQLSEAYRAEFGTDAKLSTLAQISGAATRFNKGLCKLNDA